MATIATKRGQALKKKPVCLLVHHVVVICENGELLVVSCEQHEIVLDHELLDDAPAERPSLLCARASAEFVDHDQRTTGAVAQDVAHLLQFAYEAGRVRVEVVI